MSAFGPKRTSLVAPHMSAFGGEADMTFAACLLLRSVLGAKRTWLVAAQMSANDPKRTSCIQFDRRDFTERTMRRNGRVDGSSKSPS